MTDLTLPGPFWLIGCGNMAGAMLRGWLDAGMDPALVTVIRPSGRPLSKTDSVLSEAVAMAKGALAMGACPGSENRLTPVRAICSPMRVPPPLLLPP